MSDDLLETFGGDDLFDEEEEQQETAEGEGQNRTFLIAVAIMGGLLVCALVAFGVWALVLNPRMQQAAQQSGTGVGMVTETPTGEAPTEEAKVTEEKTEAPTATAKPTATVTPTPVLGPTKTPTPESEGGAGTEGQASATATPTPSGVRRTSTPAPESKATLTPTPTRATPGGSTTEKTPETGLGELSLFGAALLLIGLFFVTRKLRKA